MPTHSFTTLTATNWGKGPDEQRAWTLTEGDWSKVRHLSSNAYWQETSPDMEGEVERTAKVKAVSDDHDVMYFDDVEHFKRFITVSMRGTVTPAE